MVISGRRSGTMRTTGHVGWAAAEKAATKQRKETNVLKTLLMNMMGKEWTLITPLFGNFRQSYNDVSEKPKTFKIKN